MKILFVASCSVIVKDTVANHAFFLQGVGLPLEKRQGDYLYSETLAGTKHFGLWPLAEAAQACFGRDTWPADVPTPQASIEFEVEDVAAAAGEMEGLGHRALHAARTEPWGQTIVRFLSPDGLLVGLCHTPWMHA